MSQPADMKLTLQEYLEWEERQERRHELVHGFLTLAMSGGTDRHDLVVARVAQLLSNALEQGPCRVYPHNRRLKVGDDTIRYPDLQVVCGRRADRHFEDAPGFILEVLSPSTGKTDVAEKVVEYRSIPSVQQYAIMHPDVRQVDVDTRHDLGWEQRRVTGGTFTFAGVELDLDQIYDFVDRKEHAAGPPPA